MNQGFLIIPKPIGIKRATGIISLFLFFSFLINAQIYSPTSSARVATSYPVFPQTDSVFVFCNSTGSLTGHIQGNPGPFNFQWSKYNQVSGLFEAYAVGAGSSHTISNLASGGYKVIITNGVNVEFRAWVFNDTPVVSAAIQNVLCGQLALIGTAEAANFIYYDPANGQAINLPNGRSFRWTSNTGAAIPNPTTNLNPVTYLPPVVDTWFYLTVTDNYGCKAVDSVFYATIETKSDFSFEPNDGSSPLTVVFSNLSTNATAYNWYFDYNKTGADGVAEDITENPQHIFNIPGTYIVALRTFSPQGCADLFVTPNPITVSQSSLEIPNVFSPNDDGYNDLFIVSHKSLKDFHGIILSRAGKKIFEWKNPDKGWDGKLSSGNDATPGAYFYIIRGEGWDGKKYELKGTMYLFRGR